MKPSPKEDFPVDVSFESDEHPAEVATFYRDIFEVQLNRTVAIYVFPAFAHDPWPPRNVDEIASQRDACRNVAASVRFSVAPSASSAGSTESFVDDEGEAHTLFYTSEAEHLRLTTELTRLAKQYPRALLSQLDSPALQHLILDRVLSSGLVNPYALEMLGRAEDRP